MILKSTKDLQCIDFVLLTIIIEFYKYQQSLTNRSIQYYICNLDFCQMREFIFKSCMPLFLDRLINSKLFLLAIRKCDKQQRPLHSRFNIHSSHKYIYSLRSQQSVSQCHNTSPNSSHYPWQHANIPVSEPHLSQASTYRVSHKQLGKFMLSFDLLCSQYVYKSPCLPHSPQIIKHINLQSP